MRIQQDVEILPRLQRWERKVLTLKNHFRNQVETLYALSFLLNFEMFAPMSRQRLFLLAQCFSGCPSLTVRRGKPDAHGTLETYAADIE
jgi:hypothetical protein